MTSRFLSVLLMVVLVCANSPSQITVGFDDKKPAPTQPLLAKAKVTIRAALIDKDLNVKPVPKLAIVLEPIGTGGAQRFSTGFDGAVDVAANPGTYTLSTPHPVAFEGEQYSWTLQISVPAGGMAVELSRDNATIPDDPATTKQETRPPDPPNVASKSPATNATAPVPTNAVPASYVVKTSPPVSRSGRQIGYSVTYDGGSLPGLKAGNGLRLYIDSDTVRFVRGKSEIASIPASTITEISYGQDVHRRVGTAIAVGLISFGLGALTALSKSKKHFVGLTWADGDKKGGLAMQCDKHDYRGVLAGLEGVSGKKAVNSDTMTVKN